MTKIIIISSLFFSALSFNAQSNKEIWASISEENITPKNNRDIIPQKYKTYHLDLSSIKTILASAPLDQNIPVHNSTIVVTLPMPDNSIQRFKVSESPVMENTLQMSYPDIRTYNVRGIDDSYASGKLDMTMFGFHGMIRSPKGDVFIDPYCKWNTSDYITYYTTDFSKPEKDRLPEIGVIDEHPSNKSITAVSAQICSGANLRTYRLAVGCTAEYAIAATGTATPSIAQTLAKVVTTVNRVDGVYETEAAIKLVLVPTTTLTLFTSTVTQPYTGNNNASTLLGESQTVITNTIGSVNFDIGHTFSTGGGGVAFLGCVCSNSIKARGITGLASPVGDPYDIDFVAHEMGHQFGGNHTFNNSSMGSCAGNRNSSTAVEPGSGVTIMAYAGICGSDDLGPHSIAYFHTISFDEIMDFSTNGSGGICPVITSTSNHPPVVTGSIAYTVPKNTPFQLTGSATDQDGDALTYQWEEVDPGPSAGLWNSGNKPFFMSYAPTTNPTRLFPKLSVILAGAMQATKGEYLPTTAQTLNFRLTARDNKMGGGGVCYASSQITMSNDGPFAITSQNVSGITYPNGSTQTITWNVNGTNSAPINCSNVNIYISTDNGNTFTLSLANTPNDGTESIVLPTVPSLKPACRVKVESVGNVFFDINDRFFAISSVSGLNQYANSDGLAIQLYPNPFSSSVKIDIAASSHFDEAKTLIRVYDVLGNVVKTEPIKLSENFSKIYDLSSLANGSYIVEVTDGKQKSVARLIKL